MEEIYMVHYITVPVRIYSVPCRDLNAKVINKIAGKIIFSCGQRIALKLHWLTSRHESISISIIFGFYLHYLLAYLIQIRFGNQMQYSCKDQFCSQTIDVCQQLLASNAAKCVTVPGQMTLPL